MNLRKLENQWFALQVKTRFEQRCARILQSKGYEEFLPLYSCNSMGPRRDATEAEPLFPGYVFCKLSTNAKGPVVTTPGVIRIVGHGGTPSSIDDDEIATIRAFVQSGRLVYPWPYLELGQRVRVSSGPLRGAEGTLVRVKNADRLVVSLSLLRRSAAVEIDASSVVSISSATA
jgi:transcription antitermination factor NusG